MDAIQCIVERRSIRKFKQDLVPHDTIREIVAAATYAPSWKNTQITRYRVVEDKELKAKIAENCVMGFEFNTKNINKAPQLVVLSYVTGRSGFEKDGSYTTSKGDRWENFDAGIAAEAFCLAAHAKGVATVMLGVFDDAKVAETINLPENEKVGILIAMGYQDCETPDAPKRKEPEEILSYL